MVTLKEFTVSTARPLPVILLLDTSQSMTLNGKLDTMNQAIAEMLRVLRDEETSRVEFQICIIGFGGDEARIHVPLQNVSKVNWSGLQGAGRTPMGKAFRRAVELIENRELIPSRAYAPTLVLVTDGHPTDASDGKDGWKPALADLQRSSRASKAIRLALAIGDDADEVVLREFLNDPSGRIFRAHEVRQIRQFFGMVTMTVSQRSVSADPNAVDGPEGLDLDMFSDF